MPGTETGGPAPRSDGTLDEFARAFLDGFLVVSAEDADPAEFMPVAHVAVRERGRYLACVHALSTGPLQDSGMLCVPRRPS